MGTESIKLAAVGDISFPAKEVDQPSLHVFSCVLPYLKDASLVIGNLENPILEKGNPVSGKCTLRGAPGWARVLRESGIHLLCLANNHIMDYGDEGLLNTIQALRNADLYYVGAGLDKNEALSPIIMDVAGTQVAILGRTSVIVSSHSYAGERQAGVAFLDVEETKKNIQSCKELADLVILLIHWGLEEYSYPSPHQRSLAREFIRAGADLILAHHPHVLQGIETIHKGMVCYSLGNFVFDDYQWTYLNEECKLQERMMKLTRENRKGGILRVALSVKGVESHDLLPTLIATDGTIKADDSFKRNSQFAHLCKRLDWPAYNLFWRAYSIKQEWSLRLKPLLRRANWSRLKKLRLKHFKQFLEMLRRSARVTAEKSTNPYE